MAKGKESNNEDDKKESNEAVNKPREDQEW